MKECPRCHGFNVENAQSCVFCSQKLFTQQSTPATTGPKLQLKPILICLGILVVIIISASIFFTDRPRSQSPSIKPTETPTTTSKQNTKGWSPDDACLFLPTLQTGTYKDLTEEGDFTCLSEMKKLGDDFPLANNIAYYASGNKELVNELKLKLNVNVKTKAKEAHDVLLENGKALCKAATKKDLPEAAQKAIKSGTNGKWTLDNYELMLVRDDWTTGKGYDLKFTIKAL